jgi:hypothetical protein
MFFLNSSVAFILAFVDFPGYHPYVDMSLQTFHSLIPLHSNSHDIINIIILCVILILALTITHG